MEAEQGEGEGGAGAHKWGSQPQVEVGRINLVEGKFGSCFGSQA